MESTGKIYLATSETDEIEALRAVPPPVAVGTWPTVLRRSKDPEADPKAREKAELAERKHWGAELLVLLRESDAPVLRQLATV